MIDHFTIPSSLQGVEALEGKLENIASAWGLSQKQIFELNLILEEICTNLIEHGGAVPPDEIKVTFSLKDPLSTPDILLVTIIDHSLEFNPEQAGEPDIHLPLAERKAGGLGLYLVRHYTDHISYSRENNTNTLSIEYKLQ